MSTGAKRCDRPVDVSTHRLKTWPELFAAVWDGRKLYEVRKDDCGYRIGDVLELEEYDPERDVRTGRIVRVRVTYKTEGGTWGLPEGMCVLSIANLERRVRVVV